jgi:hypothetical protein
VVLEGVEVAGLGPERQGDLRHLARCARMVRRQLAARLGLCVAAAACGQHHGAGVDHMFAARRAPPALALLERLQRRVLEARPAAQGPGLA